MCGEGGPGRINQLYLLRITLKIIYMEETQNTNSITVDKKNLYAAIPAVLCFAMLSAAYYFGTAYFLEENESGNVVRTETMSASTTYPQTSATSAGASPEYTAENTGDGYGDGLPGRYPDASMRLLGHVDVCNLSKEELRLMRNEIFARHGYIFKSADLNEYFNRQPWYSGRYSDVSSMLSEVENKNVAFIKQYE